ncbi:hypothetical protein [Weissella viridescens]|uniref:hypothetical protein n=1 Tax=Weissella viridescens TaxID=1629 RepID=UPI003AF24420
MPLKNRNVKKIDNKVYEPAPFDFDNQKKLKWMENMVTFVGYKGLTRDVHNYLAMKNGTYSELVLMQGRGVKNLTSQLSNELVTDAGRFFQALPEMTNISFFAYSFRVNTQVQQDGWQQMKQQIQDELKGGATPARTRYLKRRLIMIDDQLRRQRNAEKNLWNREYLMEVFAPSKGALENAISTVSSASRIGSAPFAFTQMTKSQKLDRMYNLNNPASYVIKRK